MFCWLRQHFELTSFNVMYAFLVLHCHFTQFCLNVKQSNSRCWWGRINVFFTLKFSPMISAPLFLNVTVPSLLVTVVLCEKVDIFTVRPSGPQLSIVCGHNCFLVVDYLCQTISAKSTTVFAGQSLKLRLIIRSITLRLGSNPNLQ